MPELTNGDIVAHFEVMRLLGTGGAGVVYLARDTKLGRRVALKLLAHESTPEQSQNNISSLLTEARAMAALSHPNIVNVFEVGEHHGQVFLAIEYVEGQMLRQRLQSERLSHREALRIALEIGAALVAAHAGGVLHRDLKPENILLGVDGRVRLLDFGLALPTRLNEPDAPRSEEVAVSGTPPYMAPEQWDQATCSPATDAWAFGVVLFEMLSGKRPFDDDFPLLIAAQVLSPALAPNIRERDPDVSAELADLIAQLLRKPPSERASLPSVLVKIREALDDKFTRTAEDESPFRGLLSFDSRHSAMFFGRDPELDAYLERLRYQSILPVIGVSGAGKSSFLKAGVVGRLTEQGKWLVLTARPGNQPFANLARCFIEHGVTHYERSQSSGNMQPTPLEELAVVDLASQLESDELALGRLLRELARQRACKVLLIVDQLEEVLTQAVEPTLPRRLLRAMELGADDPQDPVRVTFSLRDDFVGKLVSAGASSRLLAGSIILRCPDREALRSTIQEPLRRLGYKFDDAKLIDRMVDAVSKDDGLPLLQFTAHMLWIRRDRERHEIRATDYDAIGGVDGALALQADTVLQELSEGDVELARQLFMRLTTSVRTRRVQSEGALFAGLAPSAREVARRFIDSRLLVARRGVSGTDYEIAHESLISAWRRLGRWLDEAHLDLQVAHDVEQAALLWGKRGREPVGLWSGAGLQEAQQACARERALFSPAAQDFLHESSLAALRRQRVKRLGWVAAATLTVAIVIASVSLSIVLAGKEQRANFGQVQANAQAAQAALRVENRVAARALARQALEGADHLTARATMQELNEDPVVWQRSYGSFFRALASNGRELVAARADNVLVAIDRDTEASTPLEATGRVDTMSFAPNGQELLTCSRNDRLERVSLTGATIELLPKQDGIVDHCQYSRRGTHMYWLVTGGTHSTIRKRAVSEVGAQPSTVLQLDFYVHTLAVFDPENEPLMYAYSNGSNIHLVKATETRVLVGHQSGLLKANFSPDGSKLVSFSYDDDTVKVWSVADGALLATWHFANHPQVAEISPDGSTLAIGDAGGDLSLISLQSMSPPLHHHLSPYGILNIVFDGDNLFFSDTNESLYKVRLAILRQGPKLPRGHDQGVSDVALLGDREIISAGLDDQIIRYDAATGVPTGGFVADQRGVTGMSVTRSLDVLTAGNTKEIRRFDAATGALLLTYPAKESGMFFITESDDAKTIFAMGANLATWRAAGGARVDIQLPPDTWRGRVMPKGSFIYGNGQNEVRELDLLDGKNRKLFDVPGPKDGINWLLANTHASRLVAIVSSPQAFSIEVASNVIKPLLLPTGGLSKATLSPSGRLIVGLSKTGGIRVFDTHSLALRESSERVFDGLVMPNEDTIITVDQAAVIRPVSVADLRSRWRGPLLTDDLTSVSHLGVRSLSSAATPAHQRWHDRALSSSFGRSRGDHVCWYMLEGVIEQWNMRTDQLVTSWPSPRPQTIDVASTGCLALVDGKLQHLVPGQASGSLVREGVRAFAATRDSIEVITEEQALVLAPQPPFRVRQSLAYDGSKTTFVQRVDDLLYIATTERSFDVLDLTLSHPPQRRKYEEHWPPTTLAAGPNGTIVVGTTNGAIGLWDADLGVRLMSKKVHGSVDFLFVRGGAIYAQTDVGDTIHWDLGLLALDRCAALQQVWQDTPFVSDAGTIVHRAIPDSHECAARPK